jgi:hypothetical protein
MTNDSPSNSSSTTSTTECPWCGKQIQNGDTGVTIGPPPFHSGSETHRWILHEDCAEEWHTVAGRLRDLSNRGARLTLVEYPIEHGPAKLVES